MHGREPPGLQPFQQSPADFAVAASFFRLERIDKNAFVQGAAQLRPQRSARAHDLSPLGGIPNRLRPDRDHGMRWRTAKQLAYRLRGAHIADPATASPRESFKPGDRLGQVPARTHRLSRRQQPPAPAHIADHGISMRIKPVVDARVEDLVSRRIAPMLHDKLTGFGWAKTLADGFHGSKDSSQWCHLQVGPGLRPFRWASGPASLYCL